MKKLLMGLLVLASFNSLACDSEFALCVNDEVISDNGLRGIVKAVFQDGNVMVKFNGDNSLNKWPPRRLARTKGCSENNHLCVKNQVISDNGLMGRVEGILPNNQVMVNFDGYKSYNKWPTSRLAPTSGCTFNDYCVGDKIISDNGLEGIIKAINPDQDVMVQFKGYKSYNKWLTSRLAITDACTIRN